MMEDLVLDVIAILKDKLQTNRAELRRAEWDMDELEAMYCSGKENALSGAIAHLEELADKVRQYEKEIEELDEAIFHLEDAVDEYLNKMEQINGNK